MALVGLTLASVLIGALFWRSFAVSSGSGPQGPNSPENVDNSGQETNQTTPPSSAQRPAQIVSVFPEEDSVVCPTAEVGAGFMLEGAMLKDGEMDLASFSLTLDGEDVTAETDFGGTMDFPQSQGKLFYRPGKALSLDRHEATVSFPDAETGERQTYAWTFDVQEISCL